MRLNFATEEMEQQLREFMKPGTSDMELVRFACRTDNFYQAMVSEYKRNFELLLCGRLEQEDEHDANYTRLPEGRHDRRRNGRKDYRRNCCTRLLARQEHRQNPLTARAD